MNNNDIANPAIVNIAAYKFVTIAETDLPILQQSLKAEALDCDLKGTILIGTEGINLILAAARDKIITYQRYLNTFPQFQDLIYKESLSHTIPFDKMRVRIKSEIIRMGIPTIQPERKTAPRISPEQLKAWYDQKRDMVILDTRNDYEVAVGTFEDAMHLDIHTFRAFPAALHQLPERIKTKPVITFCTGGIRCEKAAELMLQQGFQEVYQLDGGILNYFERVGGDYYRGECFVFDHRVIINHQLQETGFTQCLTCRQAFLSERDSLASCVHCQHLRDSGAVMYEAEEEKV